MGKLSFFGILIIALLTVFSPVVNAEDAYDNFTYNEQGETLGEPQAVIPSKVFDGKALKAGSLNKPSDIFAAEDGRIYITDQGNNRILVLSSDYKLEKIIDSFNNNGVSDTFIRPGNVCVTKQNELFISDADNYRIVQIDQNGNLIRIFTKPQHPLLPEELSFIPEKVAVDIHGRIFIVSQGCTQGLIQLDKSGNFISFYGAIPTKINPLGKFWRMIQTKAQREAVEQNIPTVYSNLRVDSQGFIYTTSRDSGSGTAPKADVMLRRLNPRGSDILKRMAKNPPVGSIKGYYNQDRNSHINSQFVAVCPLSNGMYSALDSVKNRVFTYDYRGNLLFTFGTIGQQFGATGQATSICTAANGDFLVADALYNQIVVYKYTEYGKLIEKATAYQYSRDYELSRQVWKDVLKYSSKSSLAYVGIGQSALNQGDYKTAMEYFKLGEDRKGYSNAFQGYRMERVREFFKAYGLGIVLMIFMLWVGVKIIARLRKS